MKRISLWSAFTGITATAMLSAGLVVLPASSATAAVAAATPQTATAAAAQLYQPRLYTSVIARHSFKCLTIARASKSNGAKAIQNACLGGTNSTPNQLWYRSPSDDGHYRLKVLHSGKCLDIEGASRSSGARAQQYTCHHRHNQQFDILPVDDGSGYHFVVARHSGKCLAVDGSSTNNDIAVLQLACDGGLNQRWAFE